VVTYPEFLVKNKAPPLVTTDRLLNTLYVTAGTIASLYGLSKYVVDPMHKELSQARHEFFTHSNEKLQDFNARASKLTSGKSSTKEKTIDVPDNTSESSEDSDPTELFHRDVGVQTTPDLERNNSWSIQESELPTSDTITLQETRLNSLARRVRDMDVFAKGDDVRDSQEHHHLEAFSSYLNELLYTSPYYSWKNNVPSWSSATTTGASTDEFDKFKAEVKSIKGAMLSSRNFPRGA
jgi:hypothetical protein